MLTRLLSSLADKGAASASPQQADDSPAQAGGTHVVPVTAAPADGTKADHPAALREPTSRKLFQHGQPRRKRRSHAGVLPNLCDMIGQSRYGRSSGLGSVRLASGAALAPVTVQRMQDMRHVKSNMQHDDTCEQSSEPDHPSE